MKIQQKSFYADLFSKVPPQALAIKAMAPLPAALTVTSDQPKAKTNLPVPIEVAKEMRTEATADTKTQIKVSPLHDVIGPIDIHNVSPRQMTGLGQDLYTAGAISFEEYSLLAFQPELHPDFDRTIGALTGEQAAPDRPRDFAKMWDERAAFERRHNANRPDLIEQSERIASILQQIETPTNVTA